MKKTVLRRKSRLAVIVVGAAVVLALLWTAASAQPQQPPFLLYGDGDPNDVVTVYDADGQELGTTMVTEDGTWHVNVQCDSDSVKAISFSLNGNTVQAEIAQTGADQAEVMLMSSSDSMPATDTADTADSADDGDLVGEDEDLGDGSDGDLVGDEADEPSEETTMSSGDKMEDGYPESGSGGLADNGPSSEALIGTIALLAMVAAIASLGALKMRRSRNRA